ncbi:MAG: helix-turn-helix transcriptional regulator [Oscillospiraceae bacterium]|jgi:transcriptional regulator with XRE-family HTH domain|nr:helix-turn-helix transcriptional regulator [Oscillospiraceae bacterium]
MNENFPRIIALLRKERGLSQKKIAKDLGVSQALLSHYERGIRECSLNFIVKIADYYDVSCDYLLGRSPDKTGKTLKMEDLPDTDSVKKENTSIGSLLPVLNKKLLVSSLVIIFDILQKVKNKSLTNEISSYLMASVYKMFRIIYSSNNENPQGMFSVSRHIYKGFSDSLESISEIKANCIVSESKLEGFDKLPCHQRPKLSPEIISKEYPLFAPSLYNLIQSTEAKMGAKKLKLSSSLFSAGPSQKIHYKEIKREY